MKEDVAQVMKIKYFLKVRLESRFHVNSAKHVTVFLWKRLLLNSHKVSDSIQKFSSPQGNNVQNIEVNTRMLPSIARIR